MENDKEKKIRSLYNNLVDDGYKLPEYNTFKEDMTDDRKLSSLHRNLVEDEYNVPDLNTFRSDMREWWTPNLDRVTGQKWGTATTGKESGEIHPPLLAEEDNTPAWYKPKQTAAASPRETTETGIATKKAAKPTQAPTVSTPAANVSTAEPTTTVTTQPTAAPTATPAVSTPVDTSQPPMVQRPTEQEGVQTPQWRKPAEQEKAPELKVPMRDSMQEMLSGEPEWTRMRKERLDKEFEALPEDKKDRKLFDQYVNNRVQGEKFDPMTERLWTEMRDQIDKTYNNQVAEAQRHAFERQKNYSNIGYPSSAVAAPTVMNLINRREYLKEADASKTIDNIGQWLDKRISEINAETGEEEVPNAAANGESGRQWNTLVSRMYERLARKGVASSSIEYIIKKAFEGSFLGQIVNSAKSSAQKQIDAMADNKYDANWLEEAAAGAGSLILDAPLFKGAGAVGNLTARGAMGATTRLISNRLIKKGVTEEAARRLAQTNLKYDVLKNMIAGSTSSGVTFGIYDIVKEGTREVADDGKLSANRMILTGLGGIGKGAFAGVTGGAIGNMTKNWNGGFGRFAGNVIGLTGEAATFTAIGVGEELASGARWSDIDLRDDILVNLATVAMMKAQGKVGKFTDAAIEGKGVSFFNPKGKTDAQGRMLNDLKFTREQVDELKRNGYGDVDNTLGYIVDMIERHTPDIERTAEESERFVDDYAKIMNDENISLGLKRKLMYLVEGKLAPAPLVTQHKAVDSEDGKYQLVSYDYDGNEIERKTFKNGGAADDYMEREGFADKERINRIITLQDINDKAINVIAYNDAAVAYAEEKQMAISDVVDKIEAGDTETLKAISERVRNRSDLNDKRSGSILRRIGEEHGVDMVNVIAKPAAERSAQENAALKVLEDELNYNAKGIESDRFAWWRVENREKIEERMKEAKAKGEAAETPEEKHEAKRQTEEMRDIVVGKVGADKLTAVEKMFQDGVPVGSIISEMRYTMEFKPEDISATLEYLNRLNELEGVREAASKRITDAVEQEKQRVIDNSHVSKQALISLKALTADGIRDGYLVNGDWTGNDILYFKDAETGKVVPLDKSKIQGEIAVTSLETALSEAEQRTRQRLESSETDAIEYPKGISAPAVGMEMPFGETTMVITYIDDEGIRVVPKDIYEKVKDNQRELDNATAAGTLFSLDDYKSIMGEEIDYRDGIKKGEEESQDLSDEELESRIKMLSGKDEPNAFGRGLREGYLNEQKHRAEANNGETPKEETPKEDKPAEETTTEEEKPTEEKPAEEAATEEGTPKEEQKPRENVPEGEAEDHTKQEEPKADEAASTANLSSEEKDEYGKPMVLAKDGTTDFGTIDPESGLAEAPIRLSLGENRVDGEGENHGYGLLHIEAGHGDQIRKAGYASIEEFVEEVAKNYTDIREGAKIGGKQTYLLEMSDEHNNTLFVQLSRDGAYWNVNSAGIFNKKYSRRKQKVYDRPAVGDGKGTDTTEVNSGHTKGATAPAGNSSEASAKKVDYIRSGQVYTRHTTDNQPTETNGVSQRTEQSGTTELSGMNTPIPADKVTDVQPEKQGNGEENMAKAQKELEGYSDEQLQQRIDLARKEIAELQPWQNETREIKQGIIDRYTAELERRKEAAKAEESTKQPESEIKDEELKEADDETLEMWAEDYEDMLEEDPTNKFLKKELDDILKEISIRDAKAGREPREKRMNERNKNLGNAIKQGTAAGRRFIKEGHVAPMVRDLMEKICPQAVDGGIAAMPLDKMRDLIEELRKRAANITDKWNAEEQTQQGLLTGYADALENYIDARRGMDWASTAVLSSITFSPDDPAAVYPAKLAKGDRDKYVDTWNKLFAKGESKPKHIKYGYTVSGVNLPFVTKQNRDAYNTLYSLMAESGQAQWDKQLDSNGKEPYYGPDPTVNFYDPETNTVYEVAVAHVDRQGRNKRLLVRKLEYDKAPTTETPTESVAATPAEQSKPKKPRKPRAPKVLTPLEEKERLDKMEKRASRPGEYREVMDKWADEIVGLRDYILRDLCSGRIKLRWEDKGTTRGLGKHLFNGKNTKRDWKKEYGKLKWLIDDANGMTPEAYVEQICSDYFKDYERDSDHATETFSELLDILLHTPKSRDMWEEVRDNHKALEESMNGTEPDGYEGYEGSGDYGAPFTEEEIANMEMPFRTGSKKNRRRRAAKEQRRQAEQAAATTEAEETTPAVDAEETTSDGKPTVSEVERLSREMLGSGVTVIHSIDELEEGSAPYVALKNGKIVKGWTDGSKTHAFVYAPNVDSVEDLMQSLRHEGVSHVGLRELLGKERFGQLCDRVWRGMSASERDEMAGYVLQLRGGAEGFNRLSLMKQAEILSDKEFRRKAADEWMAHFSEGGDYANTSLLGRLKSWIKEALARMGFRKISVTDEDARNLLRRSENALRGRVRKENRTEEKSDESEDFRFIGEKGAARLDKSTEITTRLDNLDVARAMERSGKDAESIKLATGWEKGADKKWRYEQSDFKLKEGNDFYGLREKAYGEYMEAKKVHDDIYKELNRIDDAIDKYPRRGRTEAQKAAVAELNKKRKEVAGQLGKASDAEYEKSREYDASKFAKAKLSDWIEDEELFKAYPELAGIPIEVKYMTPRGAFTPTPHSEEIGKIEISNDQPSAQFKATLVHEIQHAIQDIEGFASGGNTRMIENARFDVEMRVNGLYSDMLKLGLGDWQRGRHTENKLEAVREFVKTLPEEKREGAQRALERLDKVIKDYGSYLGRPDESAIDVYKRLSGEVEARNAAKRIGLSPENRRRVLAETTEDVAREDQIFLQGGLGTSEMGSKVPRRMREIKEALKNADLDDNQRAVVDAFSGDKDNTRLTVEREDGSRTIIMRQGSEGGAGTKHSLYRHYGTSVGVISADDLKLVPEILTKGECEENERGRVKLNVYRYIDNNGTVYTVLTERREGHEIFNDFYTNKKAPTSASSNTPEGARSIQVEASKPSDTSTSSPEGNTPEGARRSMEDFDAAKVGQSSDTDKLKDSNRGTKADDTSFRFIGEKGAERLDERDKKRERMDDLDVAKEMENGGQSEKVIKITTGWERGADGKWRYETPDEMIDADSMPLNRRIRAKEVGDSYQEKMAKIYSKEDKLEQEIDKYPPEIRRTEAEAVEIQNIRSKLSLLRKQARDLLAERDRKLDELSPLREQTLDEVLTDKAKDLLTAYPELKDVKVSFSVMGGSTRGLCEIDEDGDLKGIKIREGMSDAQTRSTLMHEIQHAVQLLEGFARGGSAEIFVRAKEYLRGYQNELFSGANRYPEFKKWQGRHGKELDPDSPEEYYERFANEALSGEDRESLLDFIHDTRNEKEALTSALHLDELDGSTPHKMYTRIAGETEARNVQHRLNMTDKERRETPAAETEDVPREEQIVFGDTDDTAFRRVEDKETVEKLEREPKIKVYRAMQKVNGKYYPPMSGRVKSTVEGKNGKSQTKWSWRDPIKFGVWEQSEEHPEMANENGTFTLDKGNGTKIDAAYNPYIHTSRSPINDQFSSAWNRPELVTVEVEVPESELKSGYRAEKAKDAVGEVEWKSGPVGNMLAAQGNPRKVILSRYDKPIREVPVDEVADEYAKRLNESGIEVPFNTVPPALRDALVRRGVKIGEPQKGNAGEAARKAYEIWRNDKKESLWETVERLANEAGRWPGHAEYTKNRPLTEDESRGLISWISEGENVSEAEDVPFSKENWDKEFGMDKTVDTPLGKVKMGENQYAKFSKQGRNGKLGMVRPTLTEPQVVVKDYRQPKDGSKPERDYSYVFIRTFKKGDGDRQYHFTSVTVQRDGNEISISSEEKSVKTLSKLLQRSEIAWIAEDGSLHPKTQNEKSVSLGDSRAATEADNKTAPLGISSPTVSDDKYTDSELVRQENNKIFGEDKDTFFRIATGKDDKSLVGVHNISEDKLLKALKLGGLANPSAAVVDLNVGGHNKYGEISLVMPSSLVDKKSGRNVGTWSADAYTPRFPSTTKELGKDGAKRLSEYVMGLPDGMDEYMYNVFQQYVDVGNSPAPLSYLFLHEKGETPKTQHKKAKYDTAIVEALKKDGLLTKDVYSMSDAELQKLADIYADANYSDSKTKFNKDGKSVFDSLKEEGVFDAETLGKGGLDRFQSAVNRSIRQTGEVDYAKMGEDSYEEVKRRGMVDEFYKWVADKEEEFGVKELIYAGMTPSGTRKYLPLTLENISKIMKKQGRAGSESFFHDSPGGVRAQLTKKLDSLEAIRKNKGRLVNSEEFGPIAGAISDKYFELSNEIFRGDRGKFADVLTSKDMQAAAARLGIGLGEKSLKDLTEFRDFLKEAPTEYFETKFERSVDFGEFAAAVVPSDMSLVAYGALKQAGLNVVEYERGNEKSRYEALKKASEGDGILFRTVDGFDSDGRPRKMEGEPWKDFRERMDAWKKAENMRENTIMPPEDYIEAMMKMSGMTREQLERNTNSKYDLSTDDYMNALVKITHFLPEEIAKRIPHDADGVLPFIESIMKTRGITHSGLERRLVMDAVKHIKRLQGDELEKMMAKSGKAKNGMSANDYIKALLKVSGVNRDDVDAEVNIEAILGLKGIDYKEISKATTVESIMRVCGVDTKELEEELRKKGKAIPKKWSIPSLLATLKDVYGITSKDYTRGIAVESLLKNSGMSPEEFSVNGENWQDASTKDLVAALAEKLNISPDDIKNEVLKQGIVNLSGISRKELEREIYIEELMKASGVSRDRLERELAKEGAEKMDINRRAEEQRRVDKIIREAEEEHPGAAVQYLADKAALSGLTKDERIAYQRLMNDLGVDTSIDGLKRSWRDEIVLRRRYIDSSNLDTAFLASDIKKKTTKKERAMLPAIIEGTYEGEVSDKLMDVAHEIEDWFSGMYDDLVDEGAAFGCAKLDNYVTHIWDEHLSDKAVLKSYNAALKMRSKYTKKRVINSIAEGISMGLVPKYDDITDIMMDYAQAAHETIANQRLLRFMKGIRITDSAVGAGGEMTASLPLLKEADAVDPDYVLIDNDTLTGYKVHRKMADRVRTIFGSGAEWRRKAPEDMTLGDRLWKIYDVGGSYAKRVTMSLSLFHAGALTESSIAGMNPWGFAKMVGKHMIWDALVNRELPTMVDRETARDAVEHMVQLGASSDYDAKDVGQLTRRMVQWAKQYRQRHNVPGVVLEKLSAFVDAANVGMDKFLWSYLHDSYKMYAYKKYADGWRKECEKKGYSPDEVEKGLNNIGQMVNDQFGGQHWELLNITPEGLMAARRILLSPDWNLSALRQFAGMAMNTGLYDKNDFSEGKNITKKRRQQIAIMYWVKAALIFGGSINAANAMFRRKDEEKERLLAEQIRKTQPDYKSPYEIKYPDGMQWYDYTMYGNTKGKQTELFIGRNGDGSELYARWGKQFREVPEIFQSADIPQNFIDKFTGKMNPMWNAMSILAYGKSLSGYVPDGLRGEEKANAFGKWFGRVGYVMRNNAMPWSVGEMLAPSDGKDWSMVSLVMPTSKGMTSWKAKRRMEDGLKSGSMSAVEAAYDAAAMNKLDADKLLKAAISSVEATAKSEFRDGIRDLQDAVEKFDGETNPEKKAAIRTKLMKLMLESGYKTYEKEQALEDAELWISGGEKESNKRAAYNKVETYEDVRQECEMKRIMDSIKWADDRYRELLKSNASEAEAYLQRHKNSIELYRKGKALKSLQSKQKRQFGGDKDNELLENMRKERRAYVESARQQ